MPGHARYGKSRMAIGRNRVSAIVQWPHGHPKTWRCAALDSSLDSSLSRAENETQHRKTRVESVSLTNTIYAVQSTTDTAVTGTDCTPPNDYEDALPWCRVDST
jgi:hypothetical protein